MLLWIGTKLTIDKSRSLVLHSHSTDVVDMMSVVCGLVMV